MDTPERSHPEEIVCENCCYWERYTNLPDRRSGKCKRSPGPVVWIGERSPTVPQPTMTEGEWCGEFRSEWPND